MLYSLQMSDHRTSAHRFLSLIARYLVDIGNVRKYQFFHLLVIIIFFSDLHTADFTANGFG